MDATDNIHSTLYEMTPLEYADFEMSRRLAEARDERKTILKRAASRPLTEIEEDEVWQIQNYLHDMERRYEEVLNQICEEEKERREKGEEREEREY